MAKIDNYSNLPAGKRTVDALSGDLKDDADLSNGTLYFANAPAPNPIPRRRKSAT